MPPEQGRTDRAVVVSRVFAGIATAVLLLIVARVAQLKLRPGDELSRYISERVGHELEPSPRGDLLDRRGRMLSMSEVRFRVVIDPVVAEPNMERIVAFLAPALGVPEDEIGAPLARAVELNAEIRAEREAASQAATTTAGGVHSFVARLIGAITGDRAEGGPLRSGSGRKGEGRRLRRYLPVGPLLDREIATLVENLRLHEEKKGLPGVTVEKQLVRTYPGGGEIASILGKVGFGHVGLLGAERSLDGRLRGEDGQIGYMRDAGNSPVLISAEASRPGKRGEDVRLSLDLELQRIAIEELRRGMEDADAAGGRLVMMHPATGEILAMVDLYREVEGLVAFPWVAPGTPKEAWPELPPEGERPRYVTLPDDPGRDVHPAMGRNRCVEDVYEPGSTFKSFIWACAWQAGVIGEGEIIDTRPYITPFGRRFEDVTRRNEQTWEEVLVHSSNVGMVKMSERLEHSQLRSFVKRFGFGSVTRIGLPGEAPGLVTNAEKWTAYTHTSVVIGHEVAVTPVQMVRAFGAYARTGELAGTLPHLRLTSPSREELESEPLVRVLEPEVAERTRGVLVRVAERMDASMRRRFPGEPMPGYTMFGKSGTADIAVAPPVALDEDGEPIIDQRGKPVRMGKPKGAGGYYFEQYNSSFIAGAPAENPVVVVLVVIDDPGPARVRQKQHYGSQVAGPVVRRVVERSLRYLGVPPGEAVAAGG